VIIINKFATVRSALKLKILGNSVSFCLPGFLYVLLTCSILPVSFRTAAQQSRAIARFTEKDHNFGTFRESDGVVSHEFRFINEGNIPVIISNVVSDCGCTVTSWTSEPVLPGNTGTITVNYDPDDRPGTFVRPVTITSNTITPSITLVIKGVVIPVDKPEEVYQYKTGDLMLSSIYASFGEIYKGNAKKQNIRILNTGEKTLYFEFPSLPRHISVRTIPARLEPGQEGIIEMEFFTENIDDWDYVVDRIKMFINGEEAGDDLNITANIREDFSGLTSEDLLSAPSASFNTSVFDFGTLKPDSEPVTFDFILSNKGWRNLKIRKISASCGCTAIAPDKTDIEPGSFARITAVFSPSGQSGIQKKAVTVITNDPKRSKLILWIEGNVDNLTSR